MQGKTVYNKSNGPTLPWDLALVEPSCTNFDFSMSN